MRLLPFAAALVAVLFSASVLADGNNELQASPADIRAAQDTLRNNLEKRIGDYREYTNADRKALLQQQQAIYAALGDKQRLEDMTDDEKAALALALKNMQTLMAQAEDNRMICERTKSVGSNRLQTKCISVGERRRLREEVQRNGLNASP